MPTAEIAENLGLYPKITSEAALPFYSGRLMPVLAFPTTPGILYLIQGEFSSGLPQRLDLVDGVSINVGATNFLLTSTKFNNHFFSVDFGSVSIARLKRKRLG